MFGKICMTVGAIGVLSFGALLYQPNDVKAGIKNWMTSGPTVKSTTFKVEATGYDLRGYEFVTPSGKHCVFVAGSKKGGLSCS